MKKSVVLQAVVFVICSALLVFGARGTGNAVEEDGFITMSTTTSTQNSGLLDMLLPAFKADTGIKVKVIAKGTGAAIRDGMDGNVDIIFVHAREREEQFVKDGYGKYRLAVMHNDFVILGPKDDPAGLRGSTDALEALRKLAAAQAPFVSRGDDSGTHTKEQALWKESGVAVEETQTEIVKKGEKKRISFTQPADAASWYLSIGQGMGKTLTFANEKQAYTLADRGTYLNYKYGQGRGLDLDIVVEGDARLYNPYGIIPVDPKKHPHVKFDAADRFAQWLVSPKVQTLIGEYQIQGRQAFFPDALPRTD